jgi:hypothetical protein
MYIHRFKARKFYRCFFCNRFIVPKTGYVRVISTPWDNPYNEHYDAYISCLLCLDLLEHVWFDRMDAEFYPAHADDFLDQIVEYFREDSQQNRDFIKCDRMSCYDLYRHKLEWCIDFYEIE